VRHLIWVTLSLFARVCLKLVFPGFAWLSGGGESGPCSAHDHHGIYGLSFLVASFNALLAWTSASNAADTRQAIRYAAAARNSLDFRIGWPAPGAQAQAHHFARAVQLNFPEVESFPRGLVSGARRGASMKSHDSASPPPRKNRTFLCGLNRRSFLFSRFTIRKIASTLAIRFGHHSCRSHRMEITGGPINVAPHASLVPYTARLLIDAQGQRVFVYDKVHLVPLVSTTISIDPSVVTSVSGEVAVSTKATSTVVGQLPRGNTFGVFICYEATYPGEVRGSPQAGAVAHQHFE